MYTISSTVLLRGRHGTCGTRFALVAGVALGDIHGTCAWHVWHLATLSWLLRGSRGTCGTGLALVWRAWSPLVVRRRGALRGRRGTWWHPRCFCVAGGRCGTCFVANYDSEGDGLMPCWVHKEALAGQFASFVIAERPALISTASLGRPTLTQRGKKYAGFLTHNFSHATLPTQLFLHATFSHTTLSHSYTTLSQLSHTHNSFSYSTLSQTTVWNYRSSTISLVRTVSTTVSDYWKKSTCGAYCGVIRSFFLITFFIYIYIYIYICIYIALSLSHICVYFVLNWFDMTERFNQSLTAF